jgi:hypothetical protein
MSIAASSSDTMRSVQTQPSAKRIRRDKSDSSDESSSHHRRYLIGGSDYYTKCSYPEGPVTTEDLADWPKTHLMSLANSRDGMLKRKRIESLYGAGCYLHTDFTGKRCAEVTYKMLNVALRADGFEIPDTFVKVWRGCDNNTTCQDLAINSSDPPEHFFQDLKTRVSTHYRERFSRMRPQMISNKKSATREMKIAAADAYKEIDAYMVSNRPQMFGRNRTSRTCLLHPGKECRIHSFGANYFDDLADATFDDLSSDSFPNFPPVTHCIGGAECIGWTQYGAELGPADPSMETCSLFLNEAAEVNYDMTTLENSEKFPIAIFKDKMQSRAVVVHANVRAEEAGAGFPIVRGRLMATALSLSTLVWVGPSLDDPVAVQKDFEKAFGLKIMLDCNCFVGIDTDLASEEFQRGICKRRGVFPRDSEKLSVRQL